MEELHINANDVEKLIIETSGKRCEILPCLSMSDLLYIKAKMKIAKDINYKGLVCGIISRHTDGVFDENEILSLEDDTVSNYISLCVKSDSVLQTYFNELNSDSLYEGFVRAVLKYIDYFDQRDSEVYSATVSSLKLQLSSISQTFRVALKPLYEAVDMNKSYIASFQNVWGESFKSVAKSINDMLDYSSVFENIRSSIQGILQSYSLLPLSEKQKKQLITSYEKWGECGWTLPLHAGISTLSTPPADKKDANGFYKSLTTKEKMEELFRTLSNMKRIKKVDVQEAIDCFEEKHYKACAMILFSMIDSRLIRLQGSNKVRRPTGEKAAENLFNRIKPQEINEELFFTMLNHISILSALMVVFKNANNFKNQYEVINRNFLDHGMLHRNVTRRDCCQLFLLLYNFTQYLNDYIDGEE